MLNCYNNNLTELDVTNNTKLDKLYCYDNQLSSLDLSRNQQLTTLIAQNQAVEVAVLENVTVFSNPIYYHKLTTTEQVIIRGTAYAFNATVPLPIEDTVHFTTNKTLSNGSTFCGIITFVVQVTFNSNGGTDVEPIIIKIGGVIGTVANPVRESYTFAGWYTESTFANKWNLETDTVISAMTLYSKWTEGTNISEANTSTINIYPNPVHIHYM